MVLIAERDPFDLRITRAPVFFSGCDPGLHRDDTPGGCRCHAMVVRSIHLPFVPETREIMSPSA
ncbi:MAG TPA: hypothetical protein P5263_08865, partial [Methanoregulaceae archaeon]|nr:hypothetical protein [Methanoregulaceae archaeon]